MFTKTQGTIKKNEFDGVIYDADGDTLTITTDFTVISPTTLSSCAVVSPLVIEVGAVHGLEVGDSINITGSDGIARQNIVKAVGTTNIELEERIYPSTDTAVDIYINFYKITFTSNVDEGLYRFSDNVGLIIHDSFVDTTINYSNLHVRALGVDKNVNMASLNDEAKNSVIADFSFEPLFYTKVDMLQIRELLLLKMIWFISDADNKDRAKKDYTDYFNNVRNIIEVNQSNDEMSPDITEGEDIYGTDYLVWSMEV